jgi:alkylation response protein AidB-like acyl-CoA dehydrogenase
MAQHSASSVQHSRDVAEDAREKQWRGQSFLRDLFLGDYRADLFESLSLAEPDRPEFRTFYERLSSFLISEVDPVVIDTTGEYPEQVLNGLRELGAFGMKIPVEYGGLGLSHAEYMKAMQLVGSHDANVVALLSAHQAIGVPQPIKMFGTEEQKRRYLPRCARGAISAFALTEPAVGSDPARLETTAERTPDGKHFVLNGQKLWCTNGTLAELIVVMARDPGTQRINAFVVETSTPGVNIERRCHFMGLRALGNAFIHFDHVLVPEDNLIGEEGSGLKIALVTLNTGRLSLPAATAGIAKRCTEIVRKWSNARVQWGEPIGRHEAVAHLNADVVASTFAMDAVAATVAELADREGFDIRLEAAAAKEWNTARAWSVADKTLQVRGGRGYETESSLAARGEPAIGVERMLRDLRVNLIFEGSSEIMHLFMAREAVDKHLSVAGAIVDPRLGLSDKLKALPRIALFYLWWYPSRFFGVGLWPRFRQHGALGRHLRYAARASRRLARAIFHGMLVHRAALERRQAFLFRTVDIAVELFVITACVYRAAALARRGSRAALELADVAAMQRRARVEALFGSLFGNRDKADYAAGRALLEGRYHWLERGAIPLPYDADDMVPKAMSQIMQEHEQSREAARAERHTHH